MSQKNDHILGSHDTEWPVIGIVVAHWNNNEPYLLRKWLDENGIPISTNKYKDDNKLACHPV